MIDADLYVALTGCASDIVGDDIESVARGFEGSSRPLVFTETGGFKYSNLTAHEQVVAAIADQYVTPRRRNFEVKKRVG